MGYNLVRLEDTPQFWVWIDGYLKAPISMARDFYRFYSRPKTNRLPTWKIELTVYSYYIERKNGL